MRIFTETRFSMNEFFFYYKINGCGYQYKHILNDTSLSKYFDSLQNI